MLIVFNGFNRGNFTDTSGNGLVIKDAAEQGVLCYGQIGKDIHIGNVGKYRADMLQLAADGFIDYGKTRVLAVKHQVVNKIEKRALNAVQRKIAQRQRVAGFL